MGQQQQQQQRQQQQRQQQQQQQQQQYQQYQPQQYTAEEERLGIVGMVEDPEFGVAPEDTNDFEFFGIDFDDTVANTPTKAITTRETTETTTNIEFNNTVANT